jgi:biuret amidohydrolase
MPVPDPGMKIDPKNTAVVITDPQNDFFSSNGVSWPLVGESLKENNTVENVITLLELAKANNILLFVSPHYYYPTDHQWRAHGAMKALMHESGMFGRKGALNLDSFKGSGADWLEQFRPYIGDGTTVICSPHKIYGPESTDLVLQLRKRDISRVILAGMAANACVESHMRELIEQRFEVAVVKDATAGPRAEHGDGYQAALINYRFFANAVWTTEQLKAMLKEPAAVA